MASDDRQVSREEVESLPDALRIRFSVQCARRAISIREHEMRQRYVDLYQHIDKALALADQVMNGGHPEGLEDAAQAVREVANIASQTVRRGRADNIFAAPAGNIERFLVRDIGSAVAAAAEAASDGDLDAVMDAHLQTITAASRSRQNQLRG